MGFIMRMKKIKIVRRFYECIKEQLDKHQKRRRLKYHGNFVNRSKGQEKLCIILAGYKSFLYKAVFGRIEKYMEDDIDVCIITSGLFSQEIEGLCERNGWSYLSTKENNVCLVQNVAIDKHPNANFIYKLYEDVFITKDYFKKIYDHYKQAQNGDYTPGVMAPILNVNGFTHMLL